MWTEFVAHVRELLVNKCKILFTEDVKLFNDFENILQDVEMKKFSPMHAFAILQDLLHVIRDFAARDSDEKEKDDSCCNTFVKINVVDTDR
jgi:hypothetical protein